MKKNAGFVLLIALAGLLGSSLAGSPASASPACGSTLTSSVTLDSDMSCLQDGLTIGADNVTLDCAGHTFAYYVGPYVGNAPFYGVFVNGVNFATIKNCKINNAGYPGQDVAIFIYNSRNDIVLNSTFTYARTTGIVLTNASGVQITGNVLIGPEDLPGGYGADGVDLNASNGNIISSNMIQVAQHGIVLVQSTGNQIIGNDVAARSHGLQLWFHSDTNLVVGNKFTNSDYPNGVPAAVFHFLSSTNTFKNNVFSNNATAVQLSWIPPWCIWMPFDPECRQQFPSTGNLYESNSFVQNSTNVNNPQGTTGNTFTQNSFTGGAFVDSGSVYLDNQYSQTTPPAQEKSSMCPGVKAGQSTNTPNGQAVGYGQCGQGGSNASSTALSPPGATQGNK